MAPINYILLIAPLSSTDIHLLHDRILHFINMLVLFIHNHINDNAFWSVRLLSHHLTDTQPLVPSSLSTFISAVQRILVASICNESDQFGTVSFHTVLNQLISTAISLASTTTPSATCPSIGLAVSPVRSNREKLCSSVSVKTVFLVFAPLPSTPNECRSFFKSFIKHNGDDYNNMHFDQCIHRTQTCLAQSNHVAPLFTSGAIVHWISLTSFSPLGLTDRFALTNIIAMLGGLCISLHDVDFSLPLRLLFAGIAPNTVCAPSLGIPVPRNTPQSATFNIYTSDNSLIPVPVISLHPGPFPVGPWTLNGWCFPHDYYTMHQPNCLNIIHSLIVPLDTLTKDFARPLSQSNLVLFMKAKNFQSQPEFHYSIVCLLSAQYAIVHILNDYECTVVRPLPIPIENQCDISTDLIVLTSSSLPCFDTLQSRIAVEPDRAALPFDTHGLLDIDDLLLIPKSDHHKSPISDSKRKVISPSTPRRPRLSKFQPATPLRRRLGITSPLHTPGKPNNLDPVLTNLLACNSEDMAQLTQTVIDWYWALVYSHSTCLFVNLIDPILQIRDLFSSITRLDLFTMLLLTPDKVLAKFLHIKACICSTQRAPPVLSGSRTQIYSKTSRSRIDLPLPLVYNNPFDPSNSETTKFDTRGIFEPEMNFIQSQLIAVGNTHTWLREYKLREIIVQVIFHFEFLVVNKCDTSPSAARTTSSIKIDSAQQQARIAILKLLLRLDHLHRRSDPLTKKTTAHATKGHTQRKTCDPSIQSWLEKCILYNYFYHFPDFVTEIYESHGGNVHAYTQATSNAFSPLTRTNIEPPSSIPMSAPLNSCKRRLLSNINGREIVFPDCVAEPNSNPTQNAHTRSSHTSHITYPQPTFRQPRMSSATFPSRKQSKRPLRLIDSSESQDSEVSAIEPNLLKHNNNLAITQRTFFTVDNSPTIASRKHRDINSEKWFAKKLGGRTPSPTRSYADYLPGIDPDLLCEVPPVLGTGFDIETYSYESPSSSPCKGRESSSLAHAYARYNKAQVTEHRPVTVQGKVGLKSILSRFRSLKRSASGGNVLGEDVMSENIYPVDHVSHGPKTPSPPRHPVLPQTPAQHNESLLSGVQDPDEMIVSVHASPLKTGGG